MGFNKTLDGELPSRGGSDLCGAHGGGGGGAGEGAVPVVTKQSWARVCSE